MAEYIEHKFCMLLDEFPRYHEAYIPMRIEDLEQSGYYLHIVSLQKPVVTEPHNSILRLRSRQTCLPMPIESVPTALALCFLLVMIAPVKLFRATMRMLKFLFLTPWPLATFSNYLQACRLVNQIVVHEEITAFYGILQHDCMRTAIMATEFSPLPIIAQVRSPDLYSMRKEVLMRYLKEIKLVITETEDELQYLQHVAAEMEMENPPLMFECGNGIDPGEFNFHFPDSEIEVQPPFKIVSAGELHERKGFDTAVHAIKIMRDKGFDCRLKIIGFGFELWKLRRLVKKQKLTDYVEFTGGISRQALISELENAHLLLQPYRIPDDHNHDSRPFVLLEAMAAGVPVATTALPGVAEIAEHGETAILFQPDDPVVAADACIEILTDPGLRDMLIIKSRLLIEGKYNRRRCSAELVDVLEAAGIES